MALSESSLPKFDGFVGDINQLKRTGPQYKSNMMHIPSTVGDVEAFSHGFELEPLVPLLRKEDATLLPHNSLHTCDVEKQTSSGGKSNLYWFGLFMMRVSSDLKHNYQK